MQYKVRNESIQDTAGVPGMHSSHPNSEPVPKGTWYPTLLLALGSRSCKSFWLYMRRSWVWIPAGSFFQVLLYPYHAFLTTNAFDRPCMATIRGSLWFSISWPHKESLLHALVSLCMLDSSGCEVLDTLGKPFLLLVPVIINLHPGMSPWSLIPFAC